jgi:radical SAM protein with 4Fe4S-binding SPASM domain
MTSSSVLSFLESCVSGVPFPLTCHLDLPPRSWAKAGGLKEGLAPLLSRFWEVQPLAEGDSFFFYHGAEFLRWCRGLGLTTTIALPLARLTEDRLRAAVGGGLHRLVIVVADSGGDEQVLVKAVTTIERLRAGASLPRLRLEIRGRRHEALIARARSLGISEIVGGDAPSTGEEKRPPAFASAGGWRHFLKSRLVKEYCFSDFFSYSSLRAEGGIRKDCGFPWSSVRITTESAIKPCPGSDRTMGRLAEQSFEEIWNGKPYQDFRRMLLSEFPPEECRTCSLRGWFSPRSPENWIWAGINDRFGVQLGTGWHEREEGRPFRWSRKEAIFLLRNTGGKKLKLVLHLPSGKLAQEGEVFINGAKAGEFKLRRPGDRLLPFPLPAGAGEEVVVRIVSRREIVPRDVLGNDDLRRLGVAWKGAFLDQ